MSNPNKAKPLIPQWTCAVCLYKAGLGCVRIGRILHKSKCTVARWVRFAGVKETSKHRMAAGGKQAAANRAPKMARAEAFKANSRLDTIRKSYGNRAKLHDLPLFRVNRAKKKHDKEQWNKRYRHDTSFRALVTCRKRIRKLLKGINRSERTIQLVGCSPEQLVAHIESTWTEGMNWGNHGQYGWHIDHILPCASFDLSKPEDQRRCFHFTNLQALWWRDNITKGCKFLGSPPASGLPAGDEVNTSPSDRKYIEYAKS